MGSKTRGRSTSDHQDGRVSISRRVRALGQATVQLGIWSLALPARNSDVCRPGLLARLCPCAVSYGKDRSTSVVRVMLGALLGVGFLVASAASAAAHTALEASSPKDGGRLGVAPSQLVLKFTEPILSTGARVVVQGPDGRRYESGVAQVAGDTLTQPVNPLGPAGRYLVESRIVARDGHPLTAGMRFTLTMPGPAAGGARAVARPAPLAAVSASPAGQAPPWAPWIAAVAALIFVSGTVVFGRRVTRDLD